MKAAIQYATITLLPESDAEHTLCAAMLATFGEQIFALRRSGSGQNICFDALGLREALCPEPLNITRGIEPRFAAISNLAETPFLLHDEYYASVEGFWQSLKFTDQVDRRRVGALSGGRAKSTGDTAPPTGITFTYAGETIVRGTCNHWALMKQACTAKFEQDHRARTALLATGNRPLTHRVPKDSRTIPGLIMADIWMQIREELRRSA